MSQFPYYTGDPLNMKTDGWKSLPPSPRDNLVRPEGYIPNKGLIDAVNVALTLGQPLLLTGEPGTGKTQLAYSVAYELGFDKPLKFEVKSSTTAKDLFYTYDALGHFHAIQNKRAAENIKPQSVETGKTSGPNEIKDNIEEVQPQNFITFNALGIAIIRARSGDKELTFLSDELKQEEKRRSVVLIDEVDKAPRDVPNDILNEIEDMYFKIPELKNEEITADREYRPVLIFTSNSEKALPPAFLRRCIYYHIPFPQDKLLSDIVSSRIGFRVEGNNKLLDSALSFFSTLRDPRYNMRKKPGTAELLNWLMMLKKLGATVDHQVSTNPSYMEVGKKTLFKTAEDQLQADAIIKNWRSEHAHT